MTPLAKWGLALVAAVLLIVAAISLWPAPDPAPLPPKLEQALDRHAAQTAVDTLEIRRLERAAAAAAAAARADSIARVRYRRAADLQQQRADSLAAIAAASASAQDSARHYAAAYHHRTLEAEELRGALARAESETAHQRRRGDSLQVALDTAMRVATRANQLLAEAVAEIQRRNPPCRVIGPVPCPSRKVVAVATVVATLLVQRELERRDRERPAAVELRRVTVARW